MSPPPAWSLVEQVYLVSLAGFVSYFWIEGYLRGPDSSEDHPTGPKGFAVHLGSFALYNLLVGYLLVYPAILGHSLRLFTLVMALHVLGTDYDLMLHHAERFRRSGWWILVVDVLVGTAGGMIVEFVPVVRASRTPSSPVGSSSTASRGNCRAPTKQAIPPS